MRCRHVPLLPILAISAFAAACASAPSAPSASPSARSTASSEALSADASPHAYKGVIGSFPATFALVRDGGRVVGFYFYRENPSTLSLAGTIDAAGKLQMRETDGTGRATGEFKGDFSDATIEGTWIDAKTGRMLAFKATATPLKADSAMEPMSFVGTLGPRLRISGDLYAAEDGITGAYRYSTSEVDLSLNGRIREDGRLILDETDHRGRLTGRFVLQRAGRERLFGIWRQPDGRGRAFRVDASLRRVSGDPADLAKPSSGHGARLVLRGVGGQKTFAACEEVWSYIEVSGLTPEVGAKLNQRFASSTAQGQCAEFAKEIGGETTPEMKGSFESALKGRAILPNYLVTEDRMWSYTGGAHGNSGSACAAYNLGSGEPVDLASHLKPGHETELRNAIYRQIWRPQGVSRSEADGWIHEPKATNANICPNADGLTFEFSPYEIGPYALGSPVVRVPQGRWRRFFVENAVTRALFDGE